MGKQTGGILGTVTGKVGNVVGAQWKETPYFRAYKVPANPNTTAQQAQRSKMSHCVTIGRLILASIIQTFWDPFQKSISGYNRFVQVNIKAITDNSDWLNIKVAEGQLEQGLQEQDKTYSTATGICTVCYGNDIQGNGASNDNVGLVIIDTANNVAFTSLAQETRSNCEVQLNVGSGRTATDLAAYLFFYRGTGSDMLVSNSESFMLEA